ncbi:MAG: hypothetical protein R6X34_03910 [Chloroflexota bacterium]
MEGFGVIQTEENGILNLNRYLPLSETEGRLVREIEVQTGDKFTFSRGLDELTQINLDQLTVAVRQTSDRCSSYPAARLAWFSGIGLRFIRFALWKTGCWSISRFA